MNATLFPAVPVARPLRPYQEHALELLRASISSGRRSPILQLPTGAGKTRVAAEMINMALAKGNRVAFVVPRISLIQQTIRDFEREGIFDIGVVQGLHYRTDREASVQLCSAQTLSRRGERPEAAVVIIDECHLQNQHITQWIADAASPTIFIGLTATPWSKGLGRTYDDLLQPVTIAELIEASYLSAFRVFAPPGPNLHGVRTTAGDYNECDLSEAVDKQEIVANIIDTWLANGEDRPTLCYGVDRKHAQHLQERFTEAGIRTEYIDCDTLMFDREKIFDRFRSGEVRIICNVATLDTGIDLDVRCIIDARPTKSRIRFVQTIGRGLRAADGKNHCLILDHAGNHHRLGLVTEIGCDHLDNGEAGKAYDRVKGEAAPRIATCKSCNCVLPYKARECPSCGEPIYATTPIIEKDGELVELGSGRAGRADGPDKNLWHGALAWIARDKGYRSG